MSSNLGFQAVWTYWRYK